MTITAFADFGLPAAILSAVTEVGYETPSPIQAAAIPPLLAGHDIIGQAQTGTGKTAAFALPLLARLDVSVRRPQLLVLTPTRELAMQVAEAFQSYARHLPDFHVVPIYGGQSVGLQLRQLQRGAQVIVGTPGRVMDHLRRESLSLEGLRALVLDEADEMLRMGFIEDIEWILEHTPATRQTALFSATLPEPIKRVAERHLRAPREIRIKARTSTVEAVRQRYWQVAGMHKLDALTRMLEVEKVDAAIVFVRTKTASIELAEKLEARGFGAAPLNGDMGQPEREKTVEQLKSGEIDVLIATDVAARGLDVPRISHVINYDIPHDIEGYIHRIGRTGRAGRSGEAILFVAPREMRMLRAIERATRQPITPMQAPSSEAIAGKRLSQFKDTIRDTLASEELDFFAELVATMAEQDGVAVERIAGALAYLVQRERPLQPWTRRGATGHPSASVAAPASPPHRERKAAPPSAVSDAAAPARKSRPAREPSDSADRLPQHPGVDMVRYRIAVGHNQGATPKHIVGAIANEAGLDSKYIGRVEIYDDHSTVDLPDGMPRDVLRHLQKVRLGRYRFELTPQGDDGKAAPVPHKLRAPPAPAAPGGNRPPRDARAPRPAAKPRPPQRDGGTAPPKRRPGAPASSRARNKR